MHDYANAVCTHMQLRGRRHAVVVRRTCIVYNGIAPRASGRLVAPLPGCDTMDAATPPPFCRPPPSIDPWHGKRPVPEPFPVVGGQRSSEQDVCYLLGLQWGTDMPETHRRGVAELLHRLVPWASSVQSELASTRSFAGGAFSFIDYLAQMAAAHTDELRGRVEALEGAFAHLHDRAAETEANFEEVERRFDAWATDNKRVVGYFDEVDRRFRGAAADVSQLSGQLDLMRRDVMLLVASAKLAETATSAADGAEDFPPRSAAELYREAAPIPADYGCPSPALPTSDLQVQFMGAQSRACVARGSTTHLSLLGADLPLPVMAPSGLSTPGSAVAIEAFPWIPR